MKNMIGNKILQKFLSSFLLSFLLFGSNDRVLINAKVTKIELKEFELQRSFKDLKRNIFIELTQNLAWLFLVMEKEWKTEIEIDWLHFKQEWMENIAKALLKYHEIEKKLLEEYEPILIKLNS